MNILVINQPLSNRGDESAHRALIFSLLKSFPNASIKVLFLLKSESAVKALKVDERVKYININFTNYRTIINNNNLTNLNINMEFNNLGTTKDFNITVSN